MLKTMWLRCDLPGAEFKAKGSEDCFFDSENKIPYLSINLGPWTV